MKKQVRIFGKIVLIIICTLCFAFLIKKDREIFSIKQPEGELITGEEVRILMQAAGIPTDCAEDDFFLYEDYRKLLEGLTKETDTRYKTVTYDKKYKDGFYLLKEDWYHFYEEFLIWTELKEYIWEEEVNILAGKEALEKEVPETANQNEEVGRKHTEKGWYEEKGKVLSDEGEVLGYCTSVLSDCNFSKIKAYVTRDERGQKVLLSLVKKEETPFTIENVWLMEVQERGLQFFYQGYEIFCVAEDKVVNGGIVREMVSNLTFGGGKLLSVKQKTERISGRVLRVESDALELEGSGSYSLAEEVTVYRLYEELQKGSLEDIKIGYDFADFVLEDGKICAVLILRKENMESIRVAVKNEGFASLYHESLEIAADCDMELIYGAYGERKKEILKQGETLQIDEKSAYLKGDRLEILPCIQSGKIKLLSLKRSQGIPEYRGRMEVVKTENGLLLINELLLEEYLYSVVPSEMPASYPMEALKAQAVCARTYAYQYLNKPGLAHIGAHVDDSVGYQVYNNIAENSSSTTAVKETAGELLFYEGKPVSTYYYSTSCGFGADAGIWQEENVETMPYLRVGRIGEIREEAQTKESVTPKDMAEEAVFRTYLGTVNEEDYEAKEPWYRWTYKAEEIEEELFFERLCDRYEVVPDKILMLTEDEKFESVQPQAFEKVLDITVLKRREGGVIEELLLETEDGTYKVISEYNIRYLLCHGGSVVKQDDTEAALGQLLPSAYFVIDTLKEKGQVTGFRLVGGGYGHGAGMSQNAAKHMSNSGMRYGEILSFFYKDCELYQMY